jgi:hypothetical protein
MFDVWRVAGMQMSTVGGVSISYAFQDVIRICFMTTAGNKFALTAVTIFLLSPE